MSSNNVSFSQVMQSLLISGVGFIIFMLFQIKTDISILQTEMLQVKVNIYTKSQHKYDSLSHYQDFSDLTNKYNYILHQLNNTNYAITRSNSKSD